MTRANIFALLALSIVPASVSAQAVTFRNELSSSLDDGHAGAMEVRRASVLNLDAIPLMMTSALIYAEDLALDGVQVRNLMEIKEILKERNEPLARAVRDRLTSASDILRQPAHLMPPPVKDREAERARLAVVPLIRQIMANTILANQGTELVLTKEQRDTLEHLTRERDLREEDAKGGTGAKEKH